MGAQRSIVPEDQEPEFNAKAIAEVTESRYKRTDFEEEDKIVLHRQLAGNTINLAEIALEKKRSDEAYKERMDPLKKQTQRILDDLRRGFEEEKVTVYGIPNFDKGLMEFYEDDGTFFDSRRLSPQERELKLKL